MAILSKANLTAHVASSDDSRPVLTGVLLAQEGTVSADGYRMLVVPYPKGFEHDEFPARDITQWQPNGGPGVIIPAKAMGDAYKGLPKRRTYLPVIQHAHVSVDEGRAIITTTKDLETVTRTVARVVEGTYPDWHHVVPTKAPEHRVSFELRVLRRMLAAIANTGAQYITFSTFGENLLTGVRVDAWGGDVERGEEPYGVVMTTGNHARGSHPDTRGT